MSWQTRASPGPMGPPGAASKHPPPPSAQPYYQSPPPQQQPHAAPNANHFNQPPTGHQQQQWPQYTNQAPTNQPPTAYTQNNLQPNSWFNANPPNQQSFNNNNNNWPQHTQQTAPPPNHQLTHPPPSAAQPHQQQNHPQPSITQNHHSQPPPPPQTQSFQPKAAPANYQQAQPQPPNAFQYQPAQPATFANEVMSGEPEQFKAFDNNAQSGADGWDEDWSWNDTSNNNSNPAQLSQTAAPENTFAQQSFQSPAAPAPFLTPQQPPLQQQSHQTLFNPLNYQTQPQLQQQQPQQQQLVPPTQQQQLPPPQQQQQQQPPPQHAPVHQQHPPTQFYQPNQMAQQSPFMPNTSQPPQSQSPFVPNTSHPPAAQSPFVPNTSQPPQSQSPFVPNTILPPQMPPQSQSPFVGQPTAPIVANIADSFNANDSSNWNWNPTVSNATVLNPLADTASTLLDTVPAQFATVGKIASDKHHSRNASNGSNAAFDNNNPPPNHHSQPDDTTNTHVLPGRTGTSQLTPQWSIESQVSQTSSDRSLDTRSSLTNTSEEHPYQQKFPPKPFQSNGHEAADQQTNEELDFLEQTLHSLNIETQQHNSEVIDQNNDIHSYWEQSHQFNLNPSGSISLPNSNPINSEVNSESLGPYQFDPPSLPEDHSQQSNAYQYSTVPDVVSPNNDPEPATAQPPPPSVETPQQFPPTASSFPPMSNPPLMPPQTQSSAPSVQSSFQTPNPSLPPQSNSPFMPPPSQASTIPVQTPFQTVNPEIAPPTNNVNIPPPTQFTSPPVQSTPGNANPFKRTGAPSHKTLPSQSIASAPVNQPPSFAQEPPTTFFQPPPPQELPIQPDNSEVLPETLHNDRNQYLQTGHLSDENAFSPPEPSAYNPTIALDPNDYLPPPGLSRLVLGQPETNSVNNQTEPPPGLDRMVPGTELVSNLSMERQADGEDTNTPSIPIRNTTSSFNVAPTIISAVPVSQPAPLQNTDRNLYPVPGDESDSGQVQGQRVVTGHNHSDETNIPSAVVIPTSIASTEQRELIMDGENLEDEPQVILSRDEPLEGANHLDNQPSNDVDGNVAHDVAQVTASKKFPEGSLAGSTGNDDSDRDRSYYNRPPPRRSDDPPRRREKNPDKRYETEDTDFSDREKERKRFGREGSVRRSADRERSGRYPESSRAGDRYREDRSDRANVSRREAGDRGDRSDRYGKEKYRYETDGSRYATEDSRYERRDTRRRGEDDRRRENDDRKYRRNGGGEPRGEPRSDGRRRDDRYREDRERDRGQRRGNQSDRSSNLYSRHDPNEFETQRSSTRNANDRDWYNAQQQPPHQVPAGPQYGIDQYQQYYQQMQYYENLRRTNPQAYAEIYHRMYTQQQQGQQQPNQSLIADGGASGMTDGRESVHSGCSSTNDHRYARPVSASHQHNAYFDPMMAYRPQQSFSQQHNSTMHDSSFLSLGNPIDSARSTRYDSSARSQCANHNEYQELRQPRHDSGTAAESMTVDEEPARMTPCKFTRDHCSASLANGLMVCVKPQFSAHSDFTSIVRITQLGVNDAKRKLFQLYPGPLARGATHKKTVIEFCEEQIRLGPINSPSNSVLKSRGNSMNSLYSHQSQPVHRSSYTLMWNLLILLLRQNGVVVGTDISELLLSNRKEFPYEVVVESKGSSVGHPEPVAEEEEEQVEREENGETSVVSGSEGNGSTEPSVSLSQSAPISEEEITERFRSFLLYGSINEALDWAADNNLWGHALFLASKVDRRSHANVLMKFANKLSLNDPLQTLYQLMSGRTPNSVTSIQDEKWGDWRPHLAMILANTSPKPELDRKAITTLGDSLYNRGDLFAAQFCYLMAQVGFGRYCNVNQDSVLMSSSSSAIRLILLGSSHHRSFREFATNEAIMMTEIYEYACTLNDDHFSIIDFQAYKYLLATRMLDAGLNLKSLMYLEQIAQHIQKNPSKYDGGFIQKVYTLADQLKYFDPVYERMMYEPNTSNEDSPVSAQIPTTMEDQPWLQGLLSTLKQYNFGDSTTYANEPISYPEQHNVDATNQEFVEISQQLSYLSTQYQGNAEITNDPIPQAAYQSYQPLPVPQESNTYDAYGNQAQTGYDPALQSSMPVSHETYGYDQNQTFQPQQPEPEQQSYEYWNQQQQQQPQQFQPSQPDSNEPEQLDQIPDNLKLPSSSAITNTKPSPNKSRHVPDIDRPLIHTTEAIRKSHEIPEDHPHNPYPNAGSTVDGMEFKPNVDEPEMAKPSISMPNSMSNKPSFYDDDDTTNKTAGSANISHTSADQSTNASKAGPVIGAKPPNQSSSSNSGWFGGLWNKLSLKPKNQMILPDDKNPSIVWDSDKKKWVNTDGEAEASEQFRPPPKMADLAPKLAAPTLAPPAAEPPTMGSPFGGMHMAAAQPTYEPQPNMYDSAPAMPPHVPSPGPPSMVPSIPVGLDVQNGGPVAAVSSVDPTTVAKTPNLQSNMFKMQRNRTLKKSYVDVFNPSGAPSKPLETAMMAPLLPSGPPSGFFIPVGPAPTGQQDDGNQFYNPNAFAGANGPSAYQ